MVFVGQVARVDTEKDPDTGGGREYTRFQARRVYKGNPGGQPVIVQNLNTSGYMHFEPGRWYLVFATEGESGLAVAHGTREKSGPAANDADIQWLEAVDTQPPEVRIFGSVSAGNTPVPDHPVFVRGPSEHFLHTDSAGKFEIGGLAPGQYHVSMPAIPGFVPYDEDTIDIPARSCAELHYSTIPVKEKR